MIGIAFTKLELNVNIYLWFVLKEKSDNIALPLCYDTVFKCT